LLFVVCVKVMFTLRKNARMVSCSFVTTWRLVTLEIYLHWDFGQPLPSIWDGWGEEGMEKRGYLGKF
jgi:hypothetical protein